VRPSGMVYSPGDRDRAQDARSNAFSQFANTPGRATFVTLNRWAEEQGFPVEPRRLRELARARAAQDSEHAPWLPSEAYELEQRFDPAPTTAKDLQEVAARRLSDIQHAVIHGDFAQGRTVKNLPNEMEVQKWVANELRNRQGRAYSVEREPHVADEKEPDIRLRAKASDVSLPIEVKVPESWTLVQLEEALTKQLTGRYLRAQDGKHGILLLVHRHARARGWEAADGSFLTFGQVITHVRNIAEETAGSAYDAPQALVLALDVSGVGA
jgi:antitoxin component of RelBE/YafQ-DinJ toxin-antitoxin module